MNGRRDAKNKFMNNKTNADCSIKKINLLFKTKNQKLKKIPQSTSELEIGRGKALTKPFLCETVQMGQKILE